ncbi:hypothetical protein AJGP001_13555 [Planococcus faecalis]|uniref:Uncharacterized protein n=1 Tax=Planococcus faecalis TaxID=1598147 RepID=A0ABN4XQD6_9BACL|nr:hypothetical protein AJGP001_13555 [Planococcus faecalis]OHX51961.1 hypothetical protein BB777_03550 [Planococcus faecalis]
MRRSISRLRALWAWLPHKAEKSTRLRATPSPWRASAGCWGSRSELTFLGWVVGVEFWTRLATTVHAPALFFVGFGIVDEVLSGSGSRLRALWAWLSHKAEKSTRLRATPSPCRASAGCWGRLSELTFLGWVVGVEFWTRLAAVVHAPALFVFRFGIGGGVFAGF